jgi:5-methylcytosine-specific restriction endonuclease McrA
MRGVNSDCGFCRRPTEGTSWCNERCEFLASRGAPTEATECVSCGREFLVLVNRRSTRRYCARSCVPITAGRTANFGPKNGNWRGGRAMYYGPGWKAIKKQVRDRDRVCRHCGKTPGENSRALDVHHISPFRYSHDNSLDNLIALCRSCHMRADDHGRRGSAKFLRRAGIMKPLTKLQLRRFGEHLRRWERDNRRLELQRKAFELHRAGRSLREIARELGVSHQTVSNWLSGAVRRLVS